MKTKSVKGTNDYLPSEVRMRDYMQSLILDIYQRSGFERITTPALEDIENLNKSEGGENLNLLFKILKRGDKLAKVIEEEDYENLSDIGLRYDLTLPLSRYYSNNKDKLQLPFKCIQIDRVYRAERPQKGRLREFIQCDIDIIGSSSLNCEIELINTTASALLALGFDQFSVKINDRRLLKSVILRLGFTEEQVDSICISLDKYDKIGTEGVKAELLEKNMDLDKINKLLELLEKIPYTLDSMKSIGCDTVIIDSLSSIINQINQISKGKYIIEFDLTLVRGQGYYTGTIFEIVSPEFKGAIAGGGRYDNLISKFMKDLVPAVGFSIGFERIFGILRDKEYKIPTTRERIVLLYDMNQFVEAYDKAEELRKNYEVTLSEVTKKKNKLLSRLEEQGYYGFYILGQTETIQKFQDNL